MAHCKENVFTMPHQPGEVTQLILSKLTSHILDHGQDKLGQFAWQSILLDGSCNLIIVMAYHVTQENIGNCGYITSAMPQWKQRKAAGIDDPNPPTADTG